MWLRNDFKRAVDKGVNRRAAEWSKGPERGKKLITGHVYVELMERFTPEVEAEELARRGWERKRISTGS